MPKQNNRINKKNVGSATITSIVASAYSSMFDSLTN